MACHIEAQNIAHHRLNLLHPGIAKLKNLSAILANQVIVLTKGERTFVNGIGLSELMPGYQITGQQMLDGVVEGRAADTVVIPLHVEVQGIHVEMIIHGIYFAQDREAFGSFAQVKLFKIFLKNCQGLFNQFITG